MEGGKGGRKREGVEKESEIRERMDWRE